MKSWTSVEKSLLPFENAFFIIWGFFRREEAKLRRKTDSQTKLHEGTVFVSPLETKDLQQLKRRVDSIDVVFFAKEKGKMGKHPVVVSSNNHIIIIGMWQRQEKILLVVESSFVPPSHLMPGWELIVGCVGKPSAGKSTFFNAVTDGSAKVCFFLILFLFIGRQLSLHNNRTKHGYYLLLDRMSLCKEKAN